MTIPKFSSTEEGKAWLKDKITSFVESYSLANNLEEKRQSLRRFSLNDFKAEEIENPLIFGVPVSQSEEYIKIKSLLNDFFIWVNKKRKINPRFEIYLDQFFSKSHAQKMIIIAENLKRFPFLTELDQVKTVLDTYRMIYEVSLNHLKTILEIIFKKENVSIKRDFDLNILKNQFINYPKIDELLDLFDNKSRNPLGHESWNYENGILLFKTKGVVEKVKIEYIVSEIMGHIMFHMAYQALAIEGYQEIVKNDQLSEEQMDKLYISFKDRLNLL